MKNKPEEKYFKETGTILKTISNKQKKGSGKKIGTPEKIKDK